MVDRIMPGVAAIDIGQDWLYVAVAEQPVKQFGTFTSEIRLLGEYLQAHGVKQVAMEATGVYWIPLHDHLDTQGFDVTVFHGAHARNLPGRKTDVSDCQWHAMLHSHGLLARCFIPNEGIRELRGLYRLRDDHVSLAAMHVQHMQKALVLMNVRLHQVISEIQGVSGLRIIEEILAGTRDAVQLSRLCEAQILKKKRQEVVDSLQGTWQPRHLFALQQALEGYRFYQRQMRACDNEIESVLDNLVDGKVPAEKKGSGVMRHNVPTIEDLHGKLVTVCDGRDATVLPGISPISFLKLIGEVGTDLTQWKTEKHFTSWLGLAPQRHESGKSRRRRIPRRKTVAGQIFREAAFGLCNSKYKALGAFYRRIKGRKGPKVAMTALARKIAVMYYNAMTQGLEYVEQGVAAYEAEYLQRQHKQVHKMARQLGFTLTPTVPAVAS